MKTSENGLKLIKEFEGLRLEAYYCASNVLTIGYGSTGPHVTPGMTITEQQAEELLVRDLRRFEETVNKATEVSLTQSMFDALVSFTFNCGSDAYKNSTLLRLLNAGDYEGAAGQFSRWVNGANGPLPGLVRRREAEEAMFRESGFPNGSTTDKPKIVATICAQRDTLLKKEPTQGSSLADDQKVQVKEGKTYQLVWVGNTGDGHTKVSLAYNGGNWFIFNDHWDGLTEEPEAPKLTGGKVLGTRYFSQRDNYRDANRTCFSSSCAMLLETLKPGTLPGPKGDDKYIKTVFSIGDTTEAWVQTQALGRYGVASNFKQNANVQTVKKQIDNGVPCPIGILHKGPASAPAGGGHWICVIGYDDKGFICHDPWGEIDHASGNYISTNGESVHYSYGLIKARWTVANPNDGWCIIA